MRLFRSGSFLAVIDQALFSGANFLVNILLAVYLTNTEYGYFAVAFAVSMTVFVIHNAFVIEPLLVFGAGRYKNRKEGLVHLLSQFHVSGMIFLALLLVLAAFLLRLQASGLISDTLYGLALYIPAAATLITLRRLTFLEHCVSRAVFGSALYFISVITLTVLSASEIQLSAKYSLFIMGVAAAVASLSLAVRLPGTNLSLSFMTKKANKTMVSETMRYGYKSAISRIPTAAILPMYFLAIPLTSGVSAAGNARVALNLLLPFQQALAAITVRMIPNLARSSKHRSISMAIKPTKDKIVLASIAYALLIYFGYDHINQTFFDSKYDLTSATKAFLGLYLLSNSLLVLYTAGLRSRELIRPIFISGICSLLFAASIGLILIAYRGYEGLIAALFVGSFIGLWYLARALQRQVQV